MSVSIGMPEQVLALESSVPAVAQCGEKILHLQERLAEMDQESKGCSGLEDQTLL